MKLRFFVLILTMSLFIPSCTSFQQAIPTQTSMPTLTATIEPTATITLTLEPAYDLCPNIKDFRDCFVPEEELLDGSYWNWLNETVAPTLGNEFKDREDKIKYVRLRVTGIPSGAVFVYDGQTRPNYEDPETRPFDRNVTFASTFYKDSNGNIANYVVLPVFYYDKGSHQVYPVITVIPIKHEEMVEAGLNRYLNDMNVPAIIYSQEDSGRLENIAITDPIVGPFYNRIGKDEIVARSTRFYEGDVSAFSSPDMIVLADVGRTDFYK